MTDTARAREALLALLTDNSSGQITPQIVRDWLVSVPRLNTYSSNYNFAAILGSAISGGTLVGTALATMTFTAANPCPWGVNGSDSNHWLWIQGGTGTAEAVLITGGTAVAGGVTGTLTFIPANNHSGSWTIQSATAGGKEATVQAGAGKDITFPGGTHTFYAPLKMSAGAGVRGDAGGTSIVRDSTFTTGHTIECVANGSQSSTVQDLFISSSATVAAGYYAVYAQDCNLTISNVTAFNHYGNFFHNGGQVNISNCYGGGHTGIGVRLGAAGHGSGSVINSLTLSSSGQAAISMLCDVGLVSMTNFNFQLGHATSTAGHILITGGFGESTFSNGILDGGLYRISAADNGTPTFSVLFSNILCTGGAIADAWGIITSNDWQGITFNNVHFVSVGSATRPTILYLGGNGIKFVGCRIGDFLAANSVAVGFTTVLSTGVSFVGCEIGYTSAGIPDAFCKYAFDFGSLNHTYMTIEGNKLYGATSVSSALGTQVGWKVANNSGISNVAKSVAAAATLTFPFMDDQDCIEITGGTALATAVAGLREGQKITMVWTNNPPGAVSQVATIASPGFTPTRFVAYGSMFTGGKLYIEVPSP